MKAPIAAASAAWDSVRRGSWILIAGLLLTGSACALGLGAAGDPSNKLAAESAVQLNVTNLNNAPVEIYAVGSGTYYRMGTVFPGLASQFVLQPGMTIGGPVELLALAGSGQPPIRSDRLLLVSGDVVDFEINASRLTSTATVRPVVRR